MQKKPPAVDQLLRKIETLKKKIRELESSETDRLQTVQSLRSSELIYKTVFETTGTMMLIIEEDMTICMVSSGLEQLTGYTKEEILGTRKWTDFVAPDDAEKMAAHHELRRVHPELARKSYEFRLIRKDGGVRNIVLTVDAIPGTRRSVASLLDITVRKQAEEALRQSEERYRTILKNIEDGYYETDLHGNLTFFNDALRRITDYPKEELLKLNYRRYIDSEAADEVFSTFNHVYKTGVPARGFSWPIIRKDGSKRYVETSVSLKKDPSGKPVGFFGINRDVTERKSMEAELIRIRDFVENVEDGCVEMDLQGNVTFCNSAFLRLTGYTQDEYNALSHWGRQPSVLEAIRIFKIYQNVYRTGIPAGSVEHEILHKDGSVRIWDISISLIRDKSGKTVGFRSIGRDVTERKRIEAELKQTTLDLEELAFIVQQSPSIAFLWRAAEGWPVEFVSENIGIFGYTPDDFRSGRISFFQFVSPEDIERIAAEVEQYTRQKRQEFTQEYRIVTKSGESRWVDDRTWVRQDDRGAVTHYQGIITDITDRKQMEETLRRSEERYRTILDEMADGYFEVDLAGNYTFVNDANCRLLGYPREELIGASFRRQVVAEDIPLLLKAFNSIYRTGHPIRGFSYKALHKDGSIGIGEIAAFPLRDEKGKIVGFRGIAQNISERRKAEDEKVRLQEQLLQAQKMESVGRLAGGVAHDFNNMLNVILGRTEMAMHQAGPDAPINAHLLEIRKAAERSANMTRQLLAFARKQTVSPKVLFLNETVEAMLRMLRQLMGEDIHLTWLPGPHLWPVRIDPSQVDQILANLCVNARDAITGVGRVTIATENVNFAEDYCSHHMESIRGDYAMLAVSDNGCGMSREILDKLFEPYFTTKGIGKGTGLGLATIYGIIKQNNGFINVYSEPNQGTTFKIYLQRHTDGADRTEEEAAEQNYEGSETVLIAEDEPSILSLCRIMLESYGYRVFTAATPGEAIQLAKGHEGKIDLLITDVIMPEMNGRDLSMKLRTLYPDLKRLFMSGYPANVIAHHGVLEEGMHFIQKPFSGKNLVEKVRAALDQH